MGEPVPVIVDPRILAQDKIKAYADAWTPLEHIEMYKCLVIQYPYQGRSIDELDRTLRKLAK